MTRPRVVVVGLGPAGPELITRQTSEAIDKVATRLLRTTRHPAATAVVGASSCDDLYESATVFDEVYRAIAARVVDAALATGEALYAVPGSPGVLELSLIHISEPTRPTRASRIPSSA